MSDADFRLGHWAEGRPLRENTGQGLCFGRRSWICFWSHWFLGSCETGRRSPGLWIACTGTWGIHTPISLHLSQPSCAAHGCWMGHSGRKVCCGDVPWLRGSREITAGPGSFVGWTVSPGATTATLEWPLHSPVGVGLCRELGHWLGNLATLIPTISLASPFPRPVFKAEWKMHSSLETRRHYHYGSFKLYR